jgi:signal transduction histidine kinase
MVMAGFGAAILIGTAVHGGQPDHVGGRRGLTLAFAAVAYGAVLFRRRWPAVAAAATIAASAGYLATEGTYWWIMPAPALGMFHLASVRASRITLSLAAGLAGIAVVGIPWLLAPESWWGTGGGHESSVALLASCTVGLAAGDATRNRRAYLAEVEERAQQAVRDRDQEARRQVAEERLRIARDLHDSIGHPSPSSMRRRGWPIGSSPNSQYGAGRGRPHQGREPRRAGQPARHRRVAPTT